MTEPSTDARPTADPSDRPRHRTDVVVQEIEGEVVVYEPVTESLHALNGSASLVWRCCDGSGTIAEIAADIAEVLGQPDAEVEAHVVALVSDLAAKGLLVGTEPPVEAAGETDVDAGLASVPHPLAEPPSP